MHVVPGRSILQRLHENHISNFAEEIKIMIDPTICPRLNVTITHKRVAETCTKEEYFLLMIRSDKNTSQLH